MIHKKLPPFVGVSTIMLISILIGLFVILSNKSFVTEIDKMLEYAVHAIRR